MAATLFLVRRPLEKVEQSLYSASAVSSPVVGVEAALSTSSGNFAEFLCAGPDGKYSVGQPVTADDLLELVFSCPKVIVL